MISVTEKIEFRIITEEIPERIELWIETTTGKIRLRPSESESSNNFCRRMIEKLESPEIKNNLKRKQK